MAARNIAHPFRRLAAAFLLAASGLLAQPAQAQGMFEDGPRIKDTATYSTIYDAFAQGSPRDAAPAAVESAVDYLTQQLSHDEMAVRSYATSSLLAIIKTHPAMMGRFISVLETAPRSAWHQGSLAVNIAHLAYTEADAARVLKIMERLISPSDSPLNSGIALTTTEIAVKFDGLQNDALAILHALSRSPLDNSRQNITHHLGRLATTAQLSNSALDMLEILASDNTSSVSRSAINALGNVAIRNPQMAPRIMTMLDGFLQSTDESVRVNARTTIANIARALPQYTTHAMDVLAHGLQSTSVTERRDTVRILTALGRVDTTKAQSIALAAPLLNDADDTVADAAADVVIDIADGLAPYAAHILRAIEIRTQSSTSYINVSALTAAIELATVSPQFTPDALTRIEALIAKGDSSVLNVAPARLSALAIAQPAHAPRILALLQDPAALQRLTYYTSSVNAQAELAARLPAYANDVRRYLTSSLTHLTDQSARVTTITALGTIAQNSYAQSADIFTLLQTMATDPQTGTSDLSAIARTIGVVGAAHSRLENAAMTTLDTLADHSEHSVRIATVNGIQNLAERNTRISPQAIETLRRMTAIKNDSLHANIATALVKIGEYQSMHINTIVPIVQAMSDEATGWNYTLRAQLRRAQEIQQAYVIGNQVQIRARLENDLNTGLTNAALAQTMIADAQALTMSNATATRRRAVEIAAQLGRAHPSLATEAVAVAVAVAQDTDSGVRLAAAQLLGMTGMASEDAARAALPALEKLTADTDNMVAGLAVNATGMIGKRYTALAQDAVRILQPQRQNPNTLIRGSAENHLRGLPAPAP